MYTIYVKNTTSGHEWLEYGFSKRIMERLQIFINDGEFEVIWFYKEKFSFDTFKKCLLNKSEDER